MNRTNLVDRQNHIEVEEVSFSEAMATDQTHLDLAPKRFDVSWTYEISRGRPNERTEIETRKPSMSNLLAAMAMKL